MYHSVELNMLRWLAAPIPERRSPGSSGGGGSPEQDEDEGEISSPDEASLISLEVAHSGDAKIGNGGDGAASGGLISASSHGRSLPPLSPASPKVRCACACRLP